MPAPATNLFTYDRGSQAILLNALAVNQGAFTQGNAPPASSNIFGLPPVVSRGQQPFKAVVQVDSTGVFTAVVINILGSLDGVHFYTIGTIPAGGGTVAANIAAVGLFDVDPSIVRYLTAVWASGTSTQPITVSFTS